VLGLSFIVGYMFHRNGNQSVLLPDDDDDDLDPIGHYSSCLFISLYGASIRYTPDALRPRVSPDVRDRRLDGLPLGLAAADIPLHDTYYVIGHFHYVVAPGTIFALFAGIYYWFPKVTGRRMNEGMGRVHFWGSFVCMNVIFFPMLIQGLAGVSRRLYDGGQQYSHAQGVLYLNEVMSIGAWVMCLFQLVFIVNFFMSIRKGEKVGENHWHATTLDWSAAPTPPVPHGNFKVIPEVFHGPYEYSVEGQARDYSPQNEKMKG
jgi:cytochrome c oxidase subunit 1